MKRIGFALVVLSLITLQSSAAEPPRMLVEIYHIAPGQHTAFLEAIAKYDEANRIDKRLRKQLLTYYISAYPQDWYEFRADGKGQYKGVELTATKGFFHNSEARASYTWSKQTGMGSFLGTFYGPTQIPPVNSVEDFDRTNVAKLSGFSRLPWGVIVSGSYRYATGLPYSVVTYDQTGNPLYVGGRNAQRMPTIQSLDMSLQKAINLGRSDVALVAEAFNLTNHQNVTGVTTSVSSHGTPTAFDISRIFQIGVKVDF